MKLCEMDRTNRRQFLQRTGASLIGALLKGGVPKALAQKIAANPGGMAGYVDIPLIGDYGSEAVETLEYSKAVMTKLASLGIKGVQMGTSERGKPLLVAPVTGEQYAKLVELSGSQEDNEDIRHTPLGNGFHMLYNLGQDAPISDLVPVSMKDIIPRLWDKIRKLPNWSDGDHVYYHDVDRLHDLARQHDLKPPQPQTEITGHAYKGNFPPRTTSRKAPVQRSWNDFKRWNQRQNELSDQARHAFNNWMDQGDELLDKRREREQEKGQGIYIGRGYPAGMHQPFDESFRRRLSQVLDRVQ